MTHTHKTSRHHAPGTPLLAAPGAHKHRRSTSPSGSHTVRHRTTAPTHHAAHASGQSGRHLRHPSLHLDASGHDVALEGGSLRGEIVRLLDVSPQGAASTRNTARSGHGRNQYGHHAAGGSIGAGSGRHHSGRHGAHGGAAGLTTTPSGQYLGFPNGVAGTNSQYEFASAEDVARDPRAAYSVLGYGGANNYYVVSPSRRRAGRTAGAQGGSAHAGHTRHPAGHNSAPIGSNSHTFMPAAPAGLPPVVAHHARLGGFHRGGSGGGSQFHHHSTSGIHGGGSATAQQTHGAEWGGAGKRNLSSGS